MPNPIAPEACRTLRDRRLQELAANAGVSTDDAATTIRELAEPTPLTAAQWRNIGLWTGRIHRRLGGHCPLPPAWNNLTYAMAVMDGWRLERDEPSDLSLNQMCKAKREAVEG